MSKKTIKGNFVFTDPERNFIKFVPDKKGKYTLVKNAANKKTPGRNPGT